LDSKILLGIIAVTIFGTLGVQGMMVQAGVLPIETIQVTGTAPLSFSSATCPLSHPFLIGGSYSQDVRLFSSADLIPYTITPEFDVLTNTYSVTSSFDSFSSNVFVQAFALCANFNFPMQMGMIGGDLLDINTLPLLVGAIGVNPVITGLVGITIAGVAGQAVWFVHRRKKK